MIKNFSIQTIKNSLKQHHIRVGFILAGIALIGTTILSVVYSQTSDRIQHNEQQKQLQLVHQLLDQKKYNNQILDDFIIQSSHQLLQNPQPIKIYRATLNQQPYAILFETIAPDGYSGMIKLLVAINVQNDELIGVRVISHKETPSLGDYIDIDKDQWIQQFKNSKISYYINSTNWKIQKDGGETEYRTGATITPRAVTNAIHRAMLFYKQNKLRLLKK